MAFGGFFGGGSSSSSSNDDSSAAAAPSNPLLSSPAPGTSDPSSVKSRLQTAITTESNIINAKLLIQKINENCYNLCVPDPGSSLSSKESACLSTCMEKYIEGWSTVSKAYVGRLQRESVQMGGFAGAGVAGIGGKEMF